MSSTLLELTKLISASVAVLNKVCLDTGTPFPSLDEAFVPSSEAFRAHPQAAEAANVIAAAASQLISMVLPPPAALYITACGDVKSAALRVCLEAHVTEILREAGSEGVHVNDIASVTDISAEKLARIMRYMATHHIYKEIRPDVFTNTRVSSVIDTGKSVKDILANPDHKYDGTPGFAALVGHHLDEMTIACAELWETMSDPATAHSVEVSDSPFNRAVGWNGQVWDFLAQPEQKYRQRRFGVAMQGIAALQPEESVLKAYEWSSLPQGSIVVDVGGGVGTSSLALAKNLPQLHIVVQDLPHVLEETKAVWKNVLPKAVETGRVALQAHDFFKPQPVKNAAVFLVKQIMHDWPDAYASQILTNLREAAQPDTKLILIDSIMPFACHDPSSDEGEGVPGAVPREAPYPLLANYGVANEMAYNGDLTMLLGFNAQERTVRHLQELLRSTGWHMTKVVRELSSGFLQPVIAVPV